MSLITTFFKGLAMGAADVVPGVSGGTIAFITGIYDRLLGAISNCDFKLLQLVFKGKFKEAAEKIDLAFLAALFGGILIAIISLAKLITYLLANHEIAIWSFFFGLIVASAYIIIIKIKKWNLVNVLMLIAGTAIAWYLTSMQQGSMPDNLFGVFLSGFIAIIAMILPGISGSYILVMLNQYEKILGTVSRLASGDLSGIPLVIVFALGCICGLLAFSRVLKWLLDNYHDAVIALLTGFLIGSLNKVWPWKNTLETYTDRHGLTKPLIQENILPPTYDNSFFIALALSIAGLIVVIMIDKLGNRKALNP